MAAGARRRRADLRSAERREKLAGDRASLRARGDQDALRAASSIAGRRIAAGPEAAAAAAAAIRASIALQLWDAAQNVCYGISLGSVLLLAAIGLAITFGVMGVINMAHGEMVMIGAYVDLRGAADAAQPTLPALFD